jgi:ribose transport system permease protein
VISAATAGLFVLSAVIAPGSVQSSALLSMLPFAAILAIAAIGQTLVVQQGGLDLSLPGAMSLAAVLVTKGNETGMPISLLIVSTVLATVAVGAVNGVLVAYLGITPIVATLGVNAGLVGAVFAISDGFPASAPRGLNGFAVATAGGIPVLALTGAVFAVVAGLLARCTVWGRRLMWVGTNSRAAHRVGIETGRWRVAGYALAGTCYGIAGVLLAGFLNTPSITAGDSYLLPAVAAVVLAGNPLTGGPAKLLDTAVASLFLSQLTQLVLTMGATTSVQLLVQAAVIVVAVAARPVFTGLRQRTLRSKQGPATKDPAPSTPTDPTTGTSARIKEKV